MTVLMTFPREAYGKPCFGTVDFDLCTISKAPQQYVMINNRQYSSNHELDRKRREQHLPSRVSEIKYIADAYTKNSTYEDVETDVIDREDHVTQYLSELLVNTDSEITSLQVSELEDDKEEST
ncbi:uncharacterized protein LOC131841606 [Achroia grisella]|uniref:uncharacterized protein LOC131841606 n=1 Tax=Achroia grisella TaxID=688607 RepID=UPI0027D34A8B|nr:uncharacterized protein LOC131841606 [Achroia grisella]